MIVDTQMVLFTGILAGIFFVLNFSTCFSMPWSKSEVPHECSQRKCTHKRSMLCNHHKPVAWLTVITGALHIVVSAIYFL
jgi:hypothetical protein